MKGFEMKNSVLFLSIAIVATALPAHAAVTTYTDRAAFTAAAGALTTETFNSAVSQTSFQSSPVVFGPMSILGFGVQDDRNFIDIPPISFTEFNIDGTTILSAFTRTDAGLVFTFATPITAWGADFGGLQNGQLRSVINVAGETLTPPIGENGLSFYGFTSSVAFTTVTFTSSGVQDGFAIDNVSFNAVPEPSSWALMIIGFGMVGATLRRRAILTV
jgi:hypothetical protein